MAHNRVLLNASNLHVGGGVQVATSVIGELTLKNNLSPQLEIWVSDEVNNNLISSDYDLSCLPNYKIVNVYGIKALKRDYQKRISQFDRVFTIFGPLYTFSNKFFNITGFAQPWIIYPDNEIYQRLSLFEKIKIKAKFGIQKYFFSRADLLVVELEHVANGVLNHKLCKADNIAIVNNCLSSVFFDSDKWKPIKYKFPAEKLKIGFVGRNYPHKNTVIFSNVKKILKSDFGLESEFYVTFNEREWNDCTADFKENVNNVGELSVNQCPSFYKNIDAVIFPSLLECFSATPLEAMVMEKPLFASDRPFNHDVCGDNAIYFDPLDPYSAAKRIADYFTNIKVGNFTDSNLSFARERASKFSHADDRAESYLKILNSEKN